MERRRFLALLGAASSGVGFGWARKVRACGSSAAYFEEEFLDTWAVNTGSTEELAHFFSEPPLRGANERFCAGPHGQGLVYAHLDGIKVRASDNNCTSIAAPEGGRMMLDPEKARFVMRIYATGNNEQIIVADPTTGESELWGDTFGIEHIVPTPMGMVISHMGFGSPMGRLSLLTGKGEIRELLQLRWAPTPVCALGTHLVYFLNDTAYTLDLVKSGGPQVLGRLPADPIAAVMTPQGITATTAEGVWCLPLRGAPYRIFAADDVMALFTLGNSVVVTCPRRVWIGQARQFHTIEAPEANLHYVAPIHGTSDLILCRGPSVLRYLRRSGKLDHIGSGRPKMKLNGAALVNNDLLTWSSQTWVKTGRGCSVSQPPRAYVVE